MKQLSTTLKVRLICDFFQNIIVTAFLPFIALYLTDMVNQRFAGLFLFILVIINFPISLISGHIIERLPKKTLTLTYQLILSMMLIVMAFSTSKHSALIAIFCIAYAIFSITIGMQQPVMDTIIMDAITPEVEHYIYKISYWLTNIAVTLGALIGGLMYSAHKSLLFLIAFVIYMTVFIALYIWLPKDLNKVNELSVQDSKQTRFSMKQILHSYKPAFKDTTYLLLIVGFSILTMGELSASSYISIRLKQEFDPITLFSLHITGVKMYSLLLMTNTIIVIIFTYFISKIVMKMNVKKALLIGIIFYVVGYSNLTYLNHFALLIIFMIIATIGEMVYSPILEENRFKMVPSHKRGTYSAVHALGFNLAELLARFGIILGVFLTSTEMGIYMFVLLLLGGMSLYIAVSRFNNANL
ncbi:MDR family MFS transporter [Staphylococcus saccharolyticus]|uniref:Integral membrane protein LmrP n=1 Tax=Staphylococcus saccharolyticus TaxID=33028 RepID=A0A380GWV5_9STAP|nr:MFS transporter [Staphylococcus saccharolyticus]MBL7564567.1 MFS transporter [Staphylococcus saccharolyticus]MBL7571169.1 MFS transporter [Staphylococcus saccharolyticus]QQB99009.1 MFS transporter [Staphylococcus saccharolyticus]QRJ66778.1 MFS transporter [Staphylococcus saccharolyticus]SUM67559.1 integral membrane protein LmrP [Staphylococcus saccharolyticus]